MHQALRDAQIAFEYQRYLCGLESETAHAYADFALPTPWGYVLLEVDEEQHKAYDPSCDVRRDFDMAASVALGSGRKLLVLRYNPDAFKIASVTRRTTKKERHAQLIRLLGELLAREPEAPFTRLFLFYDRAAENSALPCVAEHWSEPVRSVSMGSSSTRGPAAGGRRSASLSLLRFWKAGVLPRRPTSGPGGAWCRRL